MGQLDGRVALVTGGAKSIGRHFADALARDGADIVIGDITDGAEAAQTIARDHRRNVLSRICDVADEVSVKGLVDAAMNRFGRVDILVNNAAYFADMPLMPYDRLDVATWDRVMAVNVRGAFLMAKHVGPHMVAAGYGKIINIGSGTANKGMPGMLAYVASKAALLGLTRTLARELGPHGICVNTLAPGLIESESLKANPHHLAVSERVIASRAIARAAVPQDLVGALVFLASPASDFMTGQTLAIDGGSINT